MDWSLRLECNPPLWRTMATQYAAWAGRTDVQGLLLSTAGARPAICWTQHTADARWHVLHAPFKAIHNRRNWNVSDLSDFLVRTSDSPSRSPERCFSHVCVADVRDNIRNARPNAVKGINFVHIRLHVSWSITPSYEISKNVIVTNCFMYLNTRS